MKFAQAQGSYHRVLKHNIMEQGSSEREFEMTQRKVCFELETNGHLRLWSTPQYGRNPKIPIYGIMVTY
jgi:hypothetical protein